MNKRKYQASLMFTAGLFALSSMYLAGLSMDGYAVFAMLIGMLIASTAVDKKIWDE